MNLTKFFTEYDPDVSSDLNVDPLGLQVIWSVYGQKIFKHRVSSISNDVRNYTINLFHHYVIRELIDNDGVYLSSQLLKACDEKKDTLAFKHACIVFFENIFVYSIIQLGDKMGANTSGVLGISKARRLCNEQGNNPQLIFSNEPEKSDVLVRQILLGVSGRYKTPMIEMGFFDKNYNYNLPKSLDSWDGVKQFIENQPDLSNLKNEIEKFIRTVFEQNKKLPFISFNDVPTVLKKSYITAFSSPQFVGKYSRQFWLKNSELDKGAAGALLRVLDEQFKNKLEKRSTAQVFFNLAKAKELDAVEVDKITNIEKIEPFLADIDLMFSLILCQKTQTKNEVIASWKTYGRDEGTLRNKANTLYQDKLLIKVLEGSGLKRLEALLKLRDKQTLLEQLEHLIKYHTDIMKTRQQQPWLISGDDDLLKVQVKQRKKPGIEDKPVGCWVNQYYIPQFYNLVAGFQGEEQ